MLSPKACLGNCSSALYTLIVATVTVLGNPMAGDGKGEQALEKISRLLDDRNVKAEIPQLGSPQEVQAAAYQAVADKAERVLLAGGDGLIHWAIGAFVDTNVKVGIVPVGTGNDFARALSIPRRNISKAVNIALGKPTATDMMRICADGIELWAATVLTAGFSSAVNRRARRSRWSGSKKYTLATLAELRNIETSSLKMTLDGGEVVELKSSLMAIANTKFFGGGMAVCPDATPTNGLLDVLVAKEASAFDLARILPAVFWGGHRNHKKVSMYRAKSVDLVSCEEFWVDGEQVGKAASWNVSVRPNALQLCCGGRT